MNLRSLMLAGLLGPVALLPAAPLQVGSKIGVDLGPTPTANWNNITSNNADVAAGSVVDLSGTVIDGVTITTSHAQFTNNDGTNNWVGLATNGGSAPTEFVDSVTTDIAGNFSLGDGTPYTIVVNGLDDTLTYDIVAVTTAPYARIDTVAVNGGTPSPISRPDTVTSGLFHHFNEVATDGSGKLTITVMDSAGSSNPIICGVLITPEGPQAPLVTSAPATEVRATTATMNGELVSAGTSPATVFACWGREDAGQSFNDWDHVASLGFPAPGPLAHPITELATETTYYSCFHTISADGTSWSDVQAFTPTMPQLTVAAGQALEGRSGTTALTFDVTLSYPADEDVTLTYTTLHGSTDANDFTPGGGELTIPAGQTNATITVWINGDADEEPDEQFTLRLDGANGVSISSTGIPGVILSDDGDHLSPIAVAADHASGLVYIALQTAQRIAVVAAATEQFVRSIPVPANPNGLCLNAAGTRLYITTGGPGGEVQVIDTATDTLLASWNAGHTPLAPVLSDDGSILYICNRFDGDVSVLDTVTGTTTARIPVEREPHAAALDASGSKLFVANLLPAGASTSSAIAGNVSVIDTSSRTVTNTISLPTGSHSLRGMCLAPDGSALYVTHILSRYYAPTTQVTRGWINTNALTIIDPSTATRTHTILLDDLDEGAANPWGVACSPDGSWLCVAHAGSHEISAIDRAALNTKLAATTGDTSTDLTFLAGLRQRIPLGGNGPRGIAIATGKVFAAQYFSDSLGVADLPGGSPVGRELTIGWQKPADDARRGEMFYNDATLCLQEWQSCASCHPDARADGLNWDLLNDGFGNARNTKSHIASMTTPPAMITGIRPDAETAIRAGLTYIQFVNRHESYAFDIEAYLTSLQPVPSPHLVNGQLSTAAANGQAHFTAAGCASCHSGPQFTDQAIHDGFDTPTLLELWRSGPYLHDGRAATMRDVIVSEGHGNPSGLSSAQIDELISYLLSL